MEDKQPTPVSIQDTSNTSQTVTISPDAITSDNIANPQDIEQTKHTHNFNENGECVCGGVLIEAQEKVTEISHPGPEGAPQGGSNTTDGQSGHVPAESIDAVLSNDSAVAQIAKAVTQPVMQGVVVEEKKAVMGRPSKLTPEMLSKTQDYIKRCRGDIDGKPRMPFIEELADLLRVDEDTIKNWADSNEDFFGAYKELRNLQKLRTVQRGWNAKNPTFSIFMLKANFGMMETEKQVLVQDRDVKVSITRE